MAAKDKLGRQTRAPEDEEVDLDVPSPSACPSDSAPVVLVVDDDPVVRTMLVKALGQTHTVYEAGDGEQARAILDLIPAPDALVCDVTMPRLDGLSLVKLLRQDRILRRVPVLLLSAKDAPADVISGINVGARHYVTKPFKVADLVAKVAAMTNTSKR